MKKILVLCSVLFSFFMIFAACGDDYVASCSLNCDGCRRTQFREAPNKMNLSQANSYCSGEWHLASMCEVLEWNDRSWDSFWVSEQLRFIPGSSCCTKGEGANKEYYCKGNRGLDNNEYRVLCAK